MHTNDHCAPSNFDSGFDWTLWEIFVVTDDAGPTFLENALSDPKTSDALARGVCYVNGLLMRGLFVRTTLMPQDQTGLISAATTTQMPETSNV